MLAAYRAFKARRRRENMTADAMLRIVVRARVQRLRWCMRAYFEHRRFADWARTWMDA